MCCVFLQSIDTYGQEILCSFEKDADVKAVQSSSDVKITQTTDFAALNAHSLKCSFPEKGGRVTISQFGVSSWSNPLGSENVPADALLLFVWATRPVNIEIQVTDSSENVAGDSFNLKAGANHLQLPFAKLGKLNVEKIKSFSIISVREAELYLDYVALDAFQDVLKNNGRWDVSYTDKIKTAHFPWGNTFVNGKIKTYSISPVFDGRGIIELSERLDLNYKVATIGRNPGINRWGFGDFYNRRNPGGHDGDHPNNMMLH
jgi:hypothetical protein